MTKLAELYETENWTNLGRHNFELSLLDVSTRAMKSIKTTASIQIQMVTQKKFSILWSSKESFINKK